VFGVYIMYCCDDTSVMLVTQSRNLYNNLAQVHCKRNLHVCRGFLYKVFLVQVSCSEYNAALLRATNLHARDLAKLIGRLFLTKLLLLLLEVCY